MLYDFLVLNPKAEQPLYVQLYTRIKAAVEQGDLPKGEKLPSIRKLAEDLHLSRTTVENAYQQLCVEGYIRSSPQRGYFVLEAARSGGRWNQADTMPAAERGQSPELRYNLGSDCVDSEHADLRLWRKHIKDVLGRQDILSTYGDHQGERELREALAAYSHGARGVLTRPESVVIGAGTQPLLYLLCGLLSGTDRCIGVEAPGFQQAEQVFADCGIKVIRLPVDEEGVDPAALEESGVSSLLVSPSRLKAGTIPMGRRIRLLEWAEQTGGLLIEDDYNGELRYSARPIPAMQSLNHRVVVYIGSFSKLLLPSVRIGYMVLPQPLLERYRQRAKRYNQTASKIEQLALARYIREGQLERQLRRLRKLYAAKSAKLREALKTALGDLVEIRLQETTLCLAVTLKNGMDASQAVEAARRQGVRVMAQGEGEQRPPLLRLGFAGIPMEQIGPAAEALRLAWSADEGTRLR